MAAENEASVGSRVEYEGSYGVIRYIGTLPSTNGVWFGVEWDDPTRGKNNGSVGGVQYLQTADGGPNSASFVRPARCRLGVGFMRALVERYGGVEGAVEEEMFVLGGKGGEKQKAVIMVGAEKINKMTSELGSLRQLYMRENYIRGLDDDFKTNSFPLPSAEHLDISANLISSWLDVVAITRLMPRLQELNVSSNRLKIPADFTSKPNQTSSSAENITTSGHTNSGVSNASHAFPNIRVLFINRMAYNWEELALLLPEFPSLEILHACFNDITTIPTSPVDTSVKSDKLTLINLEGNQLNDWDSALVLDSLFPNLETLILNDTGINRIGFSGSDPCVSTDNFPRLLTLSVNDNKINDWSSVKQCNRLKSLTSLRIAGNPLTELAGGKDSLYFFIIAMIGGLKRLNGATILAQERKGAEIEYIRAHGKAWLKAKATNSSAVENGTNNQSNSGLKERNSNHAAGDSGKENAEVESFLREHPRYKYLVDKHGEAMEEELQEQKTSALKNFLISINFDCPNQPNARTFSKKIPSTMTLQKLKALVQKLYSQRDSSSIRLTYTSHKLGRHSPEISLDNDLREIGFFSIENNDCIHVYW